MLIEIERLSVNPMAVAFTVPADNGGVQVYFQGVPTMVTFDMSQAEFVELINGGPGLPRPALAEARAIDG